MGDEVATAIKDQNRYRNKGVRSRDMNAATKARQAYLDQGFNNADSFEAGLNAAKTKRNIRKSRNAEKRSLLSSGSQGNTTLG